MLSSLLKCHCPAIAAVRGGRIGLLRLVCLGCENVRGRNYNPRGTRHRYQCSQIHVVAPQAGWRRLQGITTLWGRSLQGCLLKRQRVKA